VLSHDTVNLLLVCTANICRSPMAEVLFREAAARRGAEVIVGSAGLLDGGRAASDGSVQALAARGLELGHHSSRRLEAEMVTTADLVLTMEVRHVAEAAVLAPERFSRIFTMREIVGRIGSVGPRSDRTLDQWLVALNEERTSTGLLAATGLDVDDPHGGNDDDHARACTEISGLTNAVADALWGPPR
jgi:protein-tyrosine phosphatase